MFVNMTAALPLFLRNYSSFFCKSRAPFHHLYSTHTEKKPVINPEVFDFLLHKHHFSPAAAAEAASVVTHIRNPEKSDSLLSYLKENEFSNTHLGKLLKYNPSFISADLEKSVKPKIEIFQSLRFSNNDIADMLASNPSIVYRSTSNRVIPALCVLRSVLGSDANVVKLLMKSGWFLVHDLEKCMVPNIEFLKSRGVPMEQTIRCMHSFSRFLLKKPEIVRKRAEKVEEMGVLRNSKMYIHAVRVLTSMTDAAWEVKLQAFRRLGFSEDEILNAFKKQPTAFAVSVKKMEQVKEVLVSSGRYDVASIVHYPMSLACSVDKRYKPRLRVLAALETKNLINKWPNLSGLCTLNDDYFFTRDLRCLFLRNYSSYLRKSRVSFPSSLQQFYSTSTKKPVINPTVSDFLLHRHHFSPAAAAEVASVRTRLRNPEKSDSLLSFLKENEFSNTHLEKILKYCPSFISADLEKSVKPKIRIFQELGFSNNDIADLFASNASILFRSATGSVIPALCVLKRVMGSDVNIVKLLMKSGWFLVRDLEKCLVPNIEFLKGRCVPMQQIVKGLHSFPRIFLQKPEHVRKHADKAEEMGARPSTKLYFQAVRVIGSHSDEAWELKLQAFRDSGFSEDDILNAFKKNPQVFGVSVKKMVEVKELLVSCGKYDVASIISCPLSFAISIEKRFKPRLQVLAALERTNLINKWPSLSTLCKVTDEYFFGRFVGPYVDEVGHLFVAKTTASARRKAKLLPIT